jgi:hypothetical protein
MNTVFFVSWHRHPADGPLAGSQCHAHQLTATISVRPSSDSQARSELGLRDPDESDVDRHLLE